MFVKTSHTVQTIQVPYLIYFVVRIDLNSKYSAFWAGNKPIWLADSVTRIENCFQLRSSTPTESNQSRSLQVVRRSPKRMRGTAVLLHFWFIEPCGGVQTVLFFLNPCAGSCTESLILIANSPRIRSVRVEHNLKKMNPMRVPVESVRYNWDDVVIRIVYRQY
jgi:hypothetical protein